MHPIDLTQLPDRVKLEITKGDLEAFANLLLQQAQPYRKTQALLRKS